MSVDVVYKSSTGNSYNLKLKNQLKIKTANFHKYAWKADTTSRRYGNAVNRWEKDAITYPVTLIFFGNHDDRAANIEDLHADFERDIITSSPGLLVWGDCYIECYAVSSSTYPHENGIWTCNDVEFYCPYPFWIQEKTVSISEIADIPVSETDKQYPYQYSYSYSIGSGVPAQVLDYYAAMDFRMIAKGSFSDLYVTINGHPYNINYSCNSNETMVIDTRTSGIYKGQAYVVDAEGNKINVFDYRNPLYSIFQKVEGEYITIQYPRTYDLEITFFMERSEPIAASGSNYATLLNEEDAALIAKQGD